MKVAITGATGFVGSHATSAILAQDHEVRLLARRPERVASTFGSLGVPPPSDVVLGDVTDPAVVGRLLAGCDAVVHAASVFSLDPRRNAEIERINVAGTERVLGAAVEAGLRAIVHVSSVGAFLPARGQVATGDFRLGTGTDAYTRSKAGSEAVARRLRATGAPITSVLPGGVLGPHDPYLGELDAACTMVLQGKFPLLPRGANIPLVDVRDLGEVLAAALEVRRPGSYTVASSQPPLRAIVALLAERTGRRIPNIPVPDTLARATGRVADVLQRVVPADLPIRGGTMRQITSMPLVDSSAATEQLRFAPRPLEETLVDTVRWLLQAGHISRRQAGRLAPDL